MKNSRIFTESTADVKFLQDYISVILNLELASEDFDTLGSWSGYKVDGLKPSVQENADNKKTAIFIVDADDDFIARKKEISDDLVRLKIPFKLFLFPNDKDSGSLETLLCNIARQRKIIECFENYEKCISEFQSPVVKSKVFAYLDALLPKGQKKGNKHDKIKEENRDYKVKEFWDLDHTGLNQLRDFLTANLKES
jgi:hypothetical protein